METNTELILTENQSTGRILDRVFLGGRYCSFDSYYGNIYEILVEEENDEYINQKYYFEALIKLGITFRGNIYKDEEDDISTFHPDNTKQKHFPPKEVTDIMIEALQDSENGSVFHGIYGTKRGKNFGFNCENEEELRTLVDIPVLNLLRQLNTDLKEAHMDDITEDELQTNKQMAKMLGVTLTSIKRYRAKTVIERTFR